MMDERWVMYENTAPMTVAEGVVRRILAYNKDVMCVENTFEKGAVGALHSLPMWSAGCLSLRLTERKEP